jgi:hypothetical protein
VENLRDYSIANVLSILEETAAGVALDEMLTQKIRLGRRELPRRCENA